MTSGGPLVGIRADASGPMGGGHIMRCLAVADAFARRGARPVFLSHPDSERAAPALGRCGWPVLAVPSPTEPIAGILEEAGVGLLDILLIDHYDIDARQEGSLGQSARMLMAIDDLPDRRHDCDLLVDLRDDAVSQQSRAPGARVLGGLAYAPLRPEFAQMRPESLSRRRAEGDCRRLLVSLGLTDPGGITLRIVTSLLPLGADLVLDVVVGPRAPSLPGLMEISAADPSVTTHVDPPDVAGLMAAADLAVGAGGTTSWERCCLGLPSVIIQLADNQAPNIVMLTGMGAAVLASAAGEPGVAVQLRALRADGRRRRAMSLNAARLCDGDGAGRVADAALKMLSGGARPGRREPSFRS